MQILNKRVLTQAVVASSLLLCGAAAMAADVVAPETTLRTVDSNVAGSSPLNIITAGSIITNGANSVKLDATANGGTPILNVNNTTAAIELSSNQRAIFVNSAANTITGGQINISAGAIVESTGAPATIDISTTAAAATVAIVNNGTIRNTSTGNAIAITNNTAASTVTLTNNAGGLISSGAADAVNFDLAGSVINAISNSGTITSTGGSAIKNTNTAVAGTGLTSTGALNGKTKVVDFTGQASAVNLNGGSVISSDAVANIAAKAPVVGIAVVTKGVITIGGNNVNVTGILNSGAAGAAINVNPGAGNQFTSNGDLAVTAGNNVAVTSGTLNLRNNVTGGALVVGVNGTVNVIANQTVAQAIDLSAVGSKGVFDLTNSAAGAPVFGQLKTAAAGSSIAGATLTVTNAGNGYIANGTAYKIIDTGAGGLAAGAGVVRVPNGAGTNPTTGSTGVYTYTAAINPNDVTVTVARRGLNTFGSGDTNRLIAGVGSALESIGQASELAGAVNNADMMNLLGELGRLPTAAAVEDALRQLVPPTNQMTMQAAADSSNRALDVVNNRLSLARAGVDEAQGYAAGDSASGQAVWGQVFGNHADQKRRKGIFGYKSDTLGLALGTDMMVSDMVRLGVAASYSSNDSKTKSTPRNENDLKTYQFTLYGAYDLGCGWWDGMVSYANLRHKGIRRVAFGAINTVATNNHRGSEWSARVGYGYPFTSDNGWDVIPSASLSWNHITERTYTERGAAGLNLRVNSHNVDFVALGADVKFAYPMDVETGKFVPDFHLGLGYDVVSKREELNAAFVAAGPTFRVRGLEPAKFGVDAGVGLTLMTKNDVSFGVNYDANMKKDYFSHSGFLTVRYAL